MLWMGCGRWRWTFGRLRHGTLCCCNDIKGNFKVQRLQSSGGCWSLQNLGGIYVGLSSTIRVSPPVTCNLRAQAAALAIISS
jgi:hypothetical protein